MKLRIILGLVIVFALGAMVLSCGNTSASSGSADARLKVLEDKVAALEKNTAQLKSLEALTIEFADELALVNVKVASLEDKVFGK